MAPKRRLSPYPIGRTVFSTIWWLRRRHRGPASLLDEITREETRLARMRAALIPKVRPAEDPLSWDVFRMPLAPRTGRQAPSGHQICRGVQLFHDASGAAPDWQQIGGTERHALRLTCYRFEGRFLSLALAVSPDIAARALRTNGLTLDLACRASRPVALHARLNISTADETETRDLHRVLDNDPERADHRLAFDLRHIEHDGVAGGTMWIDLILRAPAMSEITLNSAKLSPEPADHAV